MQRKAVVAVASLQRVLAKVDASAPSGESPSEQIVLTVRNREGKVQLREIINGGRLP